MIGRAHAHGGPPAALGVIAADANGPTVVLLNEGLALKSAAGWSFACPRLWGDADTSAGKVPLALSTDGARTFIAGADDLYVVHERFFMPQSRPDLDRNALLAFTTSASALLALRVTGTGNELVQVDAPASAPLWSSTDDVLALTSDENRIYIATLRDRVLKLLTLERSGHMIESTTITVDRPPQLVRLQPTPGQRLYVGMYDGLRHTLDAVANGQLVRVMASDMPIDGPLANNDGTLFLIVDGMLLRAAAPSGDGPLDFEPVTQGHLLTCLGRWGSLPFACAGHELYRLDSHGLAERLFELDQLLAPDPALVPPASAKECEFQWVLFKNDLQRSGLSVREWPKPEVQDAGAPHPDGGARAELGTAGAVAPSGGAASSTAGGAASGISRNSKSCSAAQPGTPTARLDGLGALTAFACLQLARRLARRRQRRERRRLSAHGRELAYVAGLLATLAGALFPGVVSAQAQLESRPSVLDAHTPDALRRAQPVATFTGGEVTVGELEDAIADSSPLAQEQSARDPDYLPSLLARSVRFELLALEAERRGYGSAPAITKAVKDLSIQLLLKNDIEPTAGPRTIEQAAIERYWQEHQSEFARPALRRATQILLANEAQARALLPEVRAADAPKLRELVRKHSIDGPSKSRAGDLGFFDANGQPEHADTASQLDANVVAEVFALRDVGDTSGVVATATGAAILRLTGLRAAQAGDFAQAEARIRAKLAQDAKQAALDDLVARQRAASAPRVRLELIGAIQLPAAAGGP